LLLRRAARVLLAFLRALPFTAAIAPAAAAFLTRLLLAAFGALTTIRPLTTLRSSAALTTATACRVAIAPRVASRLTRLRALLRAFTPRTLALLAASTFALSRGAFTFGSKTVHVATTARCRTAPSLPLRLGRGSSHAFGFALFEPAENLADDRTIVAVRRCCCRGCSRSRDRRGFARERRGLLRRDAFDCGDGTRYCGLLGACAGFALVGGHFDHVVARRQRL
jgi:hypothetical protein